MGRRGRRRPGATGRGASPPSRARRRGETPRPRRHATGPVRARRSLPDDPATGRRHAARRGSGALATSAVTATSPGGTSSSPRPRSSPRGGGRRVDARPRRIVAGDHRARERFRRRLPGRFLLPGIGRPEMDWGRALAGRARPRRTVVHTALSGRNRGIAELPSGPPSPARRGQVAPRRLRAGWAGPGTGAWARWPRWAGISPGDGSAREFAQPLGPLGAGDRPNRAGSSPRRTRRATLPTPRGGQESGVRRAR